MHSMYKHIFTTHHPPTYHCRAPQGHAHGPTPTHAVTPVRGCAAATPLVHTPCGSAGAATTHDTSARQSNATRWWSRHGMWVVHGMPAQGGGVVGGGDGYVRGCRAHHTMMVMVVEMYAAAVCGGPPCCAMQPSTTTLPNMLRVQQMQRVVARIVDQMPMPGCGGRLSSLHACGGCASRGG